MNAAPAGEVLEVALRTLLVCGCALALALAIGVPAGLLLGRSRFPGRRSLVALSNAGMGAPPVVIGLLVALLLWRTGPLGFLGLMYSLPAMVIAQTLLATPLVAGITLAAAGALDPEWELQVRTLGVGRLRRLALLLREIRLGLLAAVAAGAGAILSEVGAAAMVGGNLEGETRVLSTAVLMYTQMGRFEEALGLAAVLLGLVGALAAFLTVVQQRERA